MKVKSLRIIFIITHTLTVSLSVFSQNSFTGIIINKANNEPISLATIGLVKENIGTYSDEKGYFTINSKYFEEDSFRISFVGFKTIILPLSGFINNTIIKLEVKEHILDNILVTNRRSKKIEELNSFNNCSQNFFNLSNESQNIIAQLYEASQKGMLLSELEICKISGESTFRIRVFDFDSTSGGPSIELTDTLIEINSKKRKIFLDLEAYNIIIPNKKFFIAFEWLKIPSNAYTKKIKHGGVKHSITFYEPGIGFKYTNDKLGAKKLWVLYYRGTWEEETLQNMNLLISVKVK